MRTHRLYTPQELKPDATVTIEGDAARYLTSVLRLAAGADLVLFNGDGNDYPCRMTAAGRNAVRFEVLDCRSNPATSPIHITLTQALGRGERMDYCLQKATELGVNVVQLLITERVELKLAGQRLDRRLAHWRAVIVSACEQSGRATVPELHPPVDIRQWLQGNAVGDRLVLDPRAAAPLSRIELGPGVDLAVGPEGGFSEDELALMVNSGVVPVRLGPRTLRTETAGPAAIAVVQAKAGDFA